MKTENLLTKLKALIVIFAILPTLIITLLVFFISKDTITNSYSGFGARIKGINRYSEILNGYLDGQIKLIREVASNPQFQGYKSELKKDFLLERFTVDSAVQQIMYFDGEGTKEIDELIQKGTEKVESSFFDENWLHTAQKGEFSLSRVFFQNNEPWLNISTPVFSHDRRSIEGVLSVNLSLSPAFYRLSEMIKQGNNITYIVDDRGKVIYVTGTLQSRFPDITPGTHMDMYQLGGMKVESLDDQYYLVSMARIDKTDWLMISKYRMTDIATTIRTLAINLAGAFFLALMFAILLSSYVGRRISKPLEDLTHFTKSIALGDYTREMTVQKADDEIGALAISFEDMRKKLKKFSDENKQLYSKTKARLEVRVRELRTLHSVTEAFAQINSMPELVSYIVGQIQDVFSARLCNIYLKDEKGRFKIEGSAEVPEGDREKLIMQEFPINKDPLDEIQKSYKALIIHDVDQEEWTHGRFLKGEVGAYCVFPLFIGNNLFGVLEIGLRKDTELVEGSIRLLTTLAKEASISIENARLYRKMAEDKNKIESIFAAINDGVVSMDYRGVITSFNKAAETITGHKADKVIGKHCTSIFKGVHVTGESNEKEYCSKDNCLLRMALEQGHTTFETEHQVTTPSGDKKTLEFSTTLERRVSDDEIAFVSVFRDVSKIRELETLRTSFIDTISHELRTPLTSIKGYVATLLHPRARFSPEEMGEFLGIINDETNHLTRMINDLLEASRLSRDTLVIKPQPFVVNEIIKTQVERFESSSDKHRFVTDLDEEQTLFGDPTQVEFVISHLLENAIKFSPDGGEIKVTLLSSTRENEALVMVEDQGVGVPPEHRDKIFDLFHRVDNRNTRRIYGPGLGLFISKRIVEAHEGKIWVESGLQGGSKFVFTLPKFVEVEGGVQAPFCPSPEAAEAAGEEKVEEAAESKETADDVKQTEN